MLWPRMSGPRIFQVFMSPFPNTSQPDPPTPLPDGNLLSPPADASPTQPPWLHTGWPSWGRWQCPPGPPSSDSSGLRTIVDIWLTRPICCLVPYTATVIFSSQRKFTAGRDYFLRCFISPTILREMANRCPFPPTAYGWKPGWCLDSVGGAEFLWHSTSFEPATLSLLPKVPNWHQDSGAQTLTPTPLNFLSLLRLWTSLATETDCNATTQETISGRCVGSHNALRCG